MVILSGLLGAAVLPALSQARSSGGKGEIAFSRYRFSSTVRKEIWIVNPDGSGLRRVAPARVNYLDYDPSWSPDGSKLLFSQCAPLHGELCNGVYSIWSVNRDSSQRRQLSPVCSPGAITPSPACPNDSQASYAPDGRHIADLRFDGTVMGIVIADSRFQGLQEMFPFGRARAPGGIDAVAWSPDGTQLAFSIENHGGNPQLPRNGRAVYIINIDGTGLHRLTPWKLNAGGVGELAWSPGKHILFRSITAPPHNEPNLATGNIYTIQPNGKGLQQLTHFPVGTGVQLGSYSPDSREIVFSTTAGATLSPSSDWPDLFLMNADGSHIHRLTRTENWEGTAAWGR
jgi:Tol biopolymer transport system component